MHASIIIVSVAAVLQMRFEVRIGWSAVRRRISIS